MEDLSPKIILGTVQMGIPYGINNSTGKITEEESHGLLDTAFKKGIRLLDTATAYGNAIDVIGNYHRASSNRFNICCKFQLAGAEEKFETNFMNCLERLHIDSFFCYEYHRINDLAIKNVAEKLASFKKERLLTSIGVSVYTADEIRQAIETPLIDIIQFPYNVLDNFTQKGLLLKAAHQKGKVLHARSVFLQGLFFKPIELFPPGLEALKEPVRKLNTIAQKYDLPLNSLALLYVAQNPLINGVLIGVDSREQLLLNLELLRKRLAPEVLQEIEAIAIAETSLLNPTLW